MAFIEDIVTQLRRLETALNEALLRLLRGCPGATRLDRAAAELGQLTTPLRDPRC